MIDDLNKLYRLAKWGETYYDRWRKRTENHNALYFTQMLPEALKCLPPEFVERYDDVYCLGDWTLERVTMSGTFRQLQVQIYKTHFRAKTRETIVMEFAEPYPFQFQTSEEVYEEADRFPYSFGYDLIDGFKFKKAADGRIDCAIILQSGATLCFTFRNMQYSVSIHPIIATWPDDDDDDD